MRGGIGAPSSGGASGRGSCWRAKEPEDNRPASNRVGGGSIVLAMRGRESRWLAGEYVAKA